MNSEISEEKTRVKWKRALELCQHADALPPIEREGFLLSACRGDEELQRTVRELLRSSESTDLVKSYPPANIVPHALVGRQVGVYRLKEFITQGGMGAVYLAERADGFFDRQVAVKFILGNLSQSEYPRFLREVRILALLRHPNLIFLFDAGLYDNGRPYLVMEYVAGKSLRDLLKASGTLPAGQAIEITRQACAGLHAAHQSGIIHRDIKPENIIVSDEQGQLSVKVLDFGIAYQQNTLETNLTGNQIIGTASYMSPEQLTGVRAEQLTPATDLYSLGLIVYEMITGQRALAGGTWTEIAYKQLNVIPAPPSTLRPDLKIPAAVDFVLMKVLHKDPQQRYQTALEFAAELEVAFGERGMSPDAVIAPAPQAQPTAQLPPGRSKAISALLVLAALAAVATGGYLAWPRTLVPAPPVGVPMLALSSSPSTLGASIPAVQSATSLAPRLSVDLLVQATPSRPFKDCNFVLLKPEITQLPSAIKAEDALLVFSGIDDQGRLNRLKDARLVPGAYLYKFTCAGFISVSDKVRLGAEPQHLGRAIVPIKLKPEQ